MRTATRPPFCALPVCALALALALALAGSGSLVLRSYPLGVTRACGSLVLRTELLTRRDLDVGRVVCLCATSMGMHLFKDLAMVPWFRWAFDAPRA